MADNKKLLEDVFDYRRAVIILTAASTGLLEYIIKNKTAGLDEICTEFHWTPRAAEIFVNALCATGYLEKKQTLYRISSHYRESLSSENYPLVREWLLHEWRLMQRWTHLHEVLETGSPYREPEKTAVHRNHRNFILSMAHREKENLESMLKAVSLKGHHHLLDLGGGPGLFALGFAEKYPDLRVTIFDAPETAPIAREFMANSPAGNRAEFRGGDFLADDLGSGYDAALLSSILHIYGPDENIALLKKVNRAMNREGKIVIRDFLLNKEKTGPLIGSLFAVNMLINTDRGNSYSFPEMKEWLKESGFRKIRKIKLEGRMLLLEAIRK